MTLSTILIVASVVAALAWLPVLGRFFSAWRKRKNPISLAICLQTVLVVYVCIVCIARMSHSVPPKWAWAMLIIFNLLVCINFYVSIWYADKRWSSDQRKPD